SFEQCFVFGPGEIEHNRLLTAIKPDEIGTLAMDDVIVVAREIAFGRSTLITRAPASARRHVHCCAATACSTETTRIPERGRVIMSAGMGHSRLRGNDRTW